MHLEDWYQSTEMGHAMAKNAEQRLKSKAKAAPKKAPKAGKVSKPGIKKTIRKVQGDQS